jgi:hypothetical protein
MKIERLKNEIKFMKKHGNYWYSPDIEAYVKVGVYEYRCLDDTNTCGIGELNVNNPNKMERFTTEIYAPPPHLTIDKYHQKYCHKKNDKWFLK